MTSVSIILPTHNRPDLLRNALASIYAQKLTSKEVIVVNDHGSPVLNIVEEWSAFLPVKYLELDHRSGLPEARNRALELADGKYVAFLDDDDIFLSWHLADAIAILEAENVDVVYGNVHVSSVYLSKFNDYVSGIYDFNFDFDPLFLLVANYIPIISVVSRNFKRDGVKFDSTLSACEDWDLFLSLYYINNFRFKHLPKTTTVYHRLLTSDSITGQAFRDTNSLQSLVSGYNQVAKKWHRKCTLKEKTFRYCLDKFHELRRRALADNVALPHNSYEMLLHFLEPRYSGSVSLEPNIAGEILEMLMAASPR